MHVHSEDRYFNFRLEKVVKIPFKLILIFHLKKFVKYHSTIYFNFPLEKVDREKCLCVICLIIDFYRS